MPKLQLWNDYSREDVHAIFSPDTQFTPQAGTWGLQGIVRVPDRPGDWVFFVTFGKEQGDHVFDESVTDDGVLSWQSQPAQRLTDATVRELVRHDDRVNTVRLFLRTKRGTLYTYLGKLGYLTHDAERERPVYFQWQLLDWPAPPATLERIGLKLLVSEGRVSGSPPPPAASLTIVAAPAPKPERQGVSTQAFQGRKKPDYASKDARNRLLGRQGELLVLAHEKATLKSANREDLADQVTHVSDLEGDGAGYDIRSFDSNGKPRHIEVKTTEGGPDTDFFISPNEVAFSAQSAGTYVLYRLFDFEVATNTAKAFVLAGNVASVIRLVPTAYRAELRPQE